MLKLKVAEASPGLALYSFDSASNFKVFGSAGLATTGGVTPRDAVVTARDAGGGAGAVDSGFEGRKVTCAGNW
jgi:hypothetical protein